MEKPGLKLTDLPDTDLIRLALEQNQAAYIVLYTRYNAGVRAHISKYVSQTEDAEDITLESFQKAFSQIATYNPEYRFSTWLFRIARNTALDHLGKKDREKNNMPTTSINEKSSEVDDIPATMHNPEEDIIKQQEYAKWIANIDKLKDDYRGIAGTRAANQYGQDPYPQGQGKTVENDGNIRRTAVIAGSNVTVCPIRLTS